MRKTLKCTPRNNARIAKLPDLYLVGYWARYGVMTVKDSGKTAKSPVTNRFYPLVWVYNDHNGTCPSWELIPIVLATTGLVECWTVSQKAANYLADALNAIFDQLQT